MRTSVLDVVGTTHGFCPKHLIKRLMLKHASCHFFKGSILPFSNIVLLWCVCNWMLKINPFMCAKINKSGVDIFSTIIYSENFDDFPRLFLCLSFEDDELVKHFTFMNEKKYPSISRKIINKGENIAGLPKRWYRKRTSYITMHQFKNCSCLPRLPLVAFLFRMFTCFTAWTYTLWKLDLR